MNRRNEIRKEKKISFKLINKQCYKWCICGGMLALILLNRVKKIFR